MRPGLAETRRDLVWRAAVWTGAGLAAWLLVMAFGAVLYLGWTAAQSGSLPRLHVEARP